MKNDPAALLILALSTLAALSVSACGDLTEAEPEQEVENVEPPQPYSPPRHEPTGPPPIARIGAGPERGTALAEGVEIRATGESVVLDLRDGARLELLPGAVGRITGEAPAQLILAQGAVHALLPPMGSSPRPPLRLGTPSGTLVIGGSGDAWAMVFADGRAWFSLTGGRAEVVHAGGDPVGLVAGRALAAGADEPTPGPEDEQTARALIATLAEGDEGEPEAATLVSALSSLDAAIEAAETSWARGAALQEAHRQASKAGNGRETLRDLARFGQETERLRGELLVHYERARALSSRLGNDPDPVVARRRSVRAALRIEEDDED